MESFDLNASQKTKSTPAGEIPVDWGVARLGDVATIKSGGTPDRGMSAYWNGDIPWVKTGEINFNIVRSASEKITQLGLKESSARIVPKGTVLMAMYGQGKTRGQVAILGIDAAINQACAAIQPCEDRLDGFYLFFDLESRYDEIRDLSNTGNQENLNAQILRTLKISLPPFAEQKKIAAILSSWDNALEKFGALIKAKECQKKTFVRKLLCDETRLNGGNNNWNKASLGDAIEFTPRATQKPSGSFLSAGIRSHGRGVFLKNNFASNDIALDELFILKTGDLVVNITFAWEGASAIVPEEADGALVSHRFPTFTFRSDKASESFFRHYILTKRFVFDCGLASPGGAGRNRVLSRSNFLDIGLRLPPLKEQIRIGEILDDAANEISLLRAQRVALEQQKRGLMQRLLTGKIRVKLGHPTS